MPVSVAGSVAPLHGPVRYVLCMGSAYFAYGSNMSSARIAARVREPRVHGPARLAGYRLVLDKLSRDGSAKANLVACAADSVWGVVYALSPADMERLDIFEPGYARCRLPVQVVARSLEAVVYVSADRRADGVAFEWYKELLLTGAREHALPLDYRARLEGLPARRDPRLDPRRRVEPGPPPAALVARPR